MKTLLNIYDWYYQTPPEEKAVRKLVDPITALVCGSILPLYEAETKIGAYDQKVIMQEPSAYKFKIPGLDWSPSLRWIPRERYFLDQEDLDIFRFNTLKVARLYNPQEVDTIKTLFDYTFKGLGFAALAYKTKIPSGAVTSYKALIYQAKEGRLSENVILSNLEERIKNIWTLKEIELINNQIEASLEKKADNKDCSSDIQSIQIKLDDKAKEFSAILEEFRQDPSLIEYLSLDKPAFPDSK